MKKERRSRNWMAILALSFLGLIAVLILTVGIPYLGGITAVLLPDRGADSGPEPTVVPVPLDEGAEIVRPGLTVREIPIVDADVTGPGPLEYNDQLGDEILARIEALRTRAGERWLVQNNAALAPFGYQLQATIHPEWKWRKATYDLYREGEDDPLLADLGRVWPVSVNASGTEFVLAAENAWDARPPYLLVRSDEVQPWDWEASYWLPPACVGDAMARITSTGFPTITYQVEVGDRAVYTGTAVNYGAYMPLRSFTAWDDHWVLAVDDQLIMDGQDMGQKLGYAAAFEFALIGDQPFYFFEQDCLVRMSYGGKTLPNTYESVVHNRCCEAAIYNVKAGPDTVWFHALREGVWYFVEAGVYDEETSGAGLDTAPEGQAGAARTEAIPGDVATRAPCLLSLDPQNALHGFVVLPLLAGLALLGGAAIVRIVLGRWPSRPRRSVELLRGRSGTGARVQHLLLGLALWIALSVFLILDLTGSISLHPGIVALYAFCWALVGLLLLYSRPLREKVVILTLFLVALGSVRFVDWNTRKPFLRALDRVTAGITEAQADEIMDGYIKGISPMAQVDEQGGVGWGTVSYRHTTEAWGNVDVGVLVFQSGRVVRVDFFPD